MGGMVGDSLTARPTHSRRVARPGAPERKRPEAAAEPKEKAFGAARDPDAAADAAMVAGKYWAHRHSLFSLYDRGVRMDAEGWYSATPEAVAASQAARAAPGDLVVDAFAGCGGNSIQFAARHAPPHLPRAGLRPFSLRAAATNSGTAASPAVGVASWSPWRSTPARWSWRRTTRRSTASRTGSSSSSATSSASHLSSRYVYSVAQGEFSFENHESLPKL